MVTLNEKPLEVTIDLGGGKNMDDMYLMVSRLLAKIAARAIGFLYCQTLEDDPPVQIDESLAAVEDLARRDMLRYFSISNATLLQLKEYQVLAGDLITSNIFVTLVT